MKTLLSLIAVLILTTPMGARAQGKAAAPGSPTFSASASVSHTLKIVAIDKASRVVTLLSADGDTLHVTCGKEVRNFAQLQVGDDVVTKYTESYTLHVEPEGKFEDTKEKYTERAKEGGQPAASVVETRRVTAKITDINKEKKTVTFQTMSGESFTVTPENPANLDKVQVGNYLVATQSIGNAVSVTKPKPVKNASTKKS